MCSLVPVACGVFIVHFFDSLVFLCYSRQYKLVPVMKDFFPEVLSYFLKHFISILKHS